MAQLYSLQASEVWMGEPPGYSALNESAVAFWLEKTHVLRVTGADRIDWLQGQVTQDLRELEGGGCLEACLVKPTGQIESHVALYALDQEVVLVTDQPRPILDRAERLVILEDVVVEHVRTGIWAVQGPESVGKYARDRTGRGGFDLVFGETAPSGVEVGGTELLDLVSLESGLPKQNVDFDDKTLPPELGTAFESRTVSYTKGCYTGQEVLMRIHSRGHTNKTWIGLRLSGPAKAGSSVEIDGKPVASLTRAAHSPRHGWIAAATLPNRYVDEGTEALVEGWTAVVQAMPF